MRHSPSETPVQSAILSKSVNSSLAFREHALYDFDDKGVDWCLRLSPHYYNTEHEAEEALAAIAAIVRTHLD